MRPGKLREGVCRVQIVGNPSCTTLANLQTLLDYGHLEVGSVALAGLVVEDRVEQSLGVNDDDASGISEEVGLVGDHRGAALKFQNDLLVTLALPWIIVGESQGVP